ncbi:hypothetical protein CPAV1605_1262 [seawater metagenome]|uniref:Uncharacterized protein n=1 Tax=seawater metagenome TaxID=1561972 RepID=A0A5E8CJP3_9ZZZZ
MKQLYLLIKNKPNYFLVQDNLISNVVINGLKKNEMSSLSCYINKKTGSNLINVNKDIFKEVNKSIIDNFTEYDDIPNNIFTYAIKFYLYKKYSVTYFNENVKIYDNLYSMEIKEEDFDLYQIKKRWGFIRKTTINYKEINRKTHNKLIYMVNEEFKLLNRVADKNLLSTYSEGIFHDIFVLRTKLDTYKTEFLPFSIILNFMGILEKIHTCNSNSLILMLLKSMFEGISTIEQFINNNLNLQHVNKIIKYQVIRDYYAINLNFKSHNINNFVDDKFNLILNANRIPIIEEEFKFS